MTSSFTPHPSSFCLFAAALRWPSALLLVVVCLAVSFLYAGIEAGLLSFSRVRVRSRAHRGDRAALRLDRLLSHPERLLVTVLLVTNFADVAALILVTEAFVDRLGNWGYAAAGAALLPVYLLGVQLLPKSLFRRFPYRALAALAGLLEGTAKLLRPPLAVGSLLRRGWFAPAPAAEGEEPAHLRGMPVAREDFKSLAAEAEGAGALTHLERGMIDGVVDFAALSAREAMAPPPESWRLSDAAKPCVEELLAHAQARQLDFLPVRGAGGELVALVDVFALLLDRDPQRPAAPYLRRPPLTVSPAESALRVLRRLRAARLPAAAVVDEAGGGFLGVLRTRDLLGRLARGAEAPLPQSGSARP